MEACGSYQPRHAKQTQKPIMQQFDIYAKVGIVGPLPLVLD
jgi:hypothetical protein